ncbi:MAG: type II toxin-antitoxin system HicB family antitoxin [Microcystis aeruginosa K13-06]|nr:type II toxin-antitoxin system HicB family antitoxin [Microcystis aeruginosa K13-06]
MQYKGYEAVIEQDENDRLFFGRKTVIEQYLTDCQTLNKNPNQPTYSLSSHER